MLKRFGWGEKKLGMLNGEEEQKKPQGDDAYTILGNAWEESEQENTLAQEENLQKLKEYTYFDGEKIFHSMKLPAGSVKKGENLCKAKKIHVQEISSG